MPQGRSRKYALFTRTERYASRGWGRSSWHHPIPQYSDPSLVEHVKQRPPPGDKERTYEHQTHDYAEGELGPQHPQHDGISVVEGVNPDSRQCCSGKVCEAHIGIIRPTYQRWTPAQNTHRTCHNLVTAGTYKPGKQGLVKPDLSARASTGTHSCGQSNGQARRGMWGRVK